MVIGRAEPFMSVLSGTNNFVMLDNGSVVCVGSIQMDNVRLMEQLEQSAKLPQLLSQVCDREKITYV